jgi:ABC-type glycerol-3-phosphate transport system substrate-binding protein
VGAKCFKEIDMKQMKILMLLIALVLVIAACGGETPAPINTPTAALVEKHTEGPAEPAAPSCISSR